METLRQQVNIDIPKSDCGYLETISREKGWKLHFVIVDSGETKKSSRLGWEAAAKKAHENNDDVMLVSEDIQDEYNTDWEW